MCDISLHHGDCLDFMRSMRGESIDCIVTDPPYLTNFRTDIYDDSSRQEDELIPKWYSEFYRILKPQGYCFVWSRIANRNPLFVGSVKDE